MNNKQKNDRLIQDLNNSINSLSDDCFCTRIQLCIEVLDSPAVTRINQDDKRYLVYYVERIRGKK
jgi:hypothetical protein